jgi:acyl-CoA thioesterase-2
MTHSHPGPVRPDVDLLELLALEPIERDLFRANAVFDDPYALYGGQVAAQALLAAGATVPTGRLPHSLHGYYLRGGDASHPTVFRVDRDRDGRSFSARRVVAIQRGEVIFNMAASFHEPQRSGPDLQAEPAPEAGDPDDLPKYPFPRLTSMEGALPEQPYPDVPVPVRFWARCGTELPDDPMLHAGVLTYLSDISTGLIPLRDEGDHSDHRPGPSLDHAVWFHRPVDMNQWVLLDLVPHSVFGGRGWYTGSLHTRAGALVASLTQEQLYRRSPRFTATR